MLLQAFFIIGGVVTLVAFGFAIFVFVRDRRRRKLLTADLVGPFSLISMLPDTSARKITLYYEEHEQPPIKINAAYLHYIRLANLGNEPVRHEDLVDSDPLRLEMRGGRILDCTVIEIHRTVSGFSIWDLEESNGCAIARISFDFLDYHDGALIRILTDTKSAEVALRGTVIGMPEGVKDANVGFRKRSRFAFPTLLFSALAWSALLAFFLVFGAGAQFDLGTGQVVKPPNAWIILTAMLAWVGLMLVGFQLFFKFLGPDSRHRQWPKELSFPPSANRSIFRDLD